MLYYAIVFLPLLGFLIAGLFGNQIGARPSELVTTGLMLIVLVLSWVVFFQIPLGHDAETVRIPVLHWVTSGGLSFDWALRVDTLTGVMLVVVNTVSALVHIYSIGYMRGNSEPRQTPFYSAFAVAIFSTMGVALSGNLITLFLFYELLSLSTFPLVTHKQSPEAMRAGRVYLLTLIGASMILLPKFDPEQIFKYLPQATSMMGVPTFYVRLLQDARLNRETTKHMRLFVSGSAPLLAETHREWRERTGHAILERYGMTETNMNTSNPYDGDRVAGTVGFPLPGVSAFHDDRQHAVSLAFVIPVTGTCEPRQDALEVTWMTPEEASSESLAAEMEGGRSTLIRLALASVGALR